MHGPLKGTWLAVRRLSRCHPIEFLGGGSGIDPVTSRLAVRSLHERTAQSLPRHRPMVAVLFGWQYFVAMPRMQEEQANVAEQQKTEMPALTPGTGAGSAARRRLPRAEALAQALRVRDRNADRRRLGQPDRRRASTIFGCASTARRPIPGARRSSSCPRRGRAALCRRVRLARRRRARPRLPNGRHRVAARQGGTLSPGNDIELSYDNGQGLTYHPPHRGRRPLHVHRHRHGEQRGSAPVTLTP